MTCVLVTILQALETDSPFSLSGTARCFFLCGDPLLFFVWPDSSRSSDVSVSDSLSEILNICAMVKLQVKRKTRLIAFSFMHISKYAV